METVAKLPLPIDMSFHSGEHMKGFTSTLGFVFPFLDSRVISCSKTRYSTQILLTPAFAIGITDRLRNGGSISNSTMHTINDNEDV